MADSTKKTELEKLRELEAKDREDRARKCSEEFQKILAKYNCTAVPFVTVSAEGNQAGLKIQAK